MDVRCAKCGIEYEFDDAKVTAAGVTVKCTNCGHVFKVKREEAASVPPSPSTSFGQVGNFAPQSTFAKGLDGGEWMVKRVDGQVFRFKELTTLQKWIVERKVGRDDEISKTGKTWKKLGEIAELASFFQVVDAANAALQASVIPVQPAMPSPGAVAGLVVMPSTNPGVQVPAHLRAPNAGLPPANTQGAPLDIHDSPTAQIEIAQVPVVPAAAPAATPTTAPQQRPEPAPAPAPPAKPKKPANDDVGIDALDDDDPVLQMIKRRRRNTALVVVLLVLVAGGVAAAAFWPQVQAALGIAGPVVSSAEVEGARKALKTDQLAALQAAREALVTPSPATTSWAILLDIAVASHESEQARIEENLAALLPAEGPEHLKRAKALRESAATALAASYPSINKVRDTPNLADGHLASAAYNLEKGGLAEQHADLEAARAAAKAEPAIDAEIAVQQALADVHAAFTSGDVKAALDKLVTSSDGRLVYAKAALAVAALQKAKPINDAELSSARAAVAAVPAGDERVALLAQVLDVVAKSAASPAPSASTDAGPATAAADAGVAVAKSADAGVAKVEPKGDEGAAAAAPAAGGGSYDVIMSQAERARVNDKSKVAHELFLKATKLKPTAPRPWLGLGWTALDLGKNAEAAKNFRKVLELDDNLAEAEFGLAESLRYIGQKDQAVEAYKTYLKMDPTGKDAGTAKRAIEALQ